MFGKNTNANLLDEVTRMNDEAIRAEESGEYEKIIPLIDNALKLSCKINPYQLLNWIVEFNYARYHQLYDPQFDKRRCRDIYINLRNIVKNNMSIENFEEIKETYIILLINLIGLLIDGKQNDLIESIIKEVFELLDAVDIGKERREYLYILASGTAAAYNLRMGNYALGIHFGTSVLEMIEFDDIICEQKLFFLNQLLFTYELAGQLDRAIDLGRFLYVKYLKEELQTDNLEEIHRMILGYVNALAETGNHRLALHVMNKSFQKGITDDPSQDTYLMNFYFSYVNLAEICKVKVSDEIYEKIKTLMEQRKIKRDFLEEFISEDASLDLVAYKIAKERGEEYQKFLDSVYERYVQKGCPEGEFIAYYGQMIILLREFGQMQEMSKVKNCGRHLMIQLYKYIQYCQYYIDNDRMLQALNNVEMAFSFAYSSLIELVPEEKKFEYLLNYKNLLPTIVRFRDRKVEGDTELSDILKEVNAVKDLIAQKSSSLLSLSMNRDQIEQLKRRLTELENVFSERYGHKEKIPHYSIEDFKQVVPNNSIVIDIFFSKLDLYLQPIEENIESFEYNVMETFVWIKEEECQLHYYKNENVKELINLLNDFIETIQNPHRKYKKKADLVYKEMFGNCIDNIGNIDTVYICPHIFDANVPFDIILAQNYKLEKCKIIYMQTLREFFYQSEVLELSDICIIGNPSYRLNEKYTDDIISGKRGTHLVPLPFSEYEAKSIAKIFNKRCYTGKLAMKNRIKSGYRIFHIATHGFSDREGMENVWYSSSLSFAGIIDWLDSGVEQSLYGNGILTADEISRMNLKGTDLVVLSACNSGNSLLYGVNHLAGLHIAFAAAGVDYIISSLWEVDDFATAVLMQLFYDEWVHGNPVEKSLVSAKSKIQVMTVEEIYKYMIENGETQSIPDNILKKLLQMDSRVTLFSHPCYWAGFVCYKNSFI